MKFLILLIFLIPFQNHPVLSANILPRLTPIKICGAIAIIMSINEYFKTLKTNKVPIPAQGKIFIIWAICVLILSFTWYPSVGADSIRSFISFIIFFIAVTQLVKTKSDLNKIFWACLISMAWSSLYMYKEYFTLRHVFNGFRPRGSFGDSNYYCIASIIVIPMGLAIYNTSIGKLKLYAAILTTLIVGGVIVSQSRGGFLGVSIITALYILTARQKFKAFSFATVLMVTGLLFMPANFWDRIQKVEVKETTDVAGDDLSNRRRIELPRSGILMFMDNKVWGVGPGNFKENSAVYNPILWELNGPGVAHNTFIELLGELGLFGTTCFMLIFMITLKRLKQIRVKHKSDKFIHQFSLAITIGILAFILCSNFLSAQFSKFYWLAIFLTIPLNTISINEIKSILTLKKDVK